MRWLVHGNITPALTAALDRHGHSFMPVSELVPGESPNLDEIFKAVVAKQFDIITTDRAVVDWPMTATKKFGRSIVYLQLEGGDVEQDDAIDRLFARYKSPKTGMLYTVTENRVKVRQLPGL